jgi:hypothetical protein
MFILPSKDVAINIGYSSARKQYLSPSYRFSVRKCRDFLKKSSIHLLHLLEYPVGFNKVLFFTSIVGSCFSSTDGTTALEIYVIKIKLQNLQTSKEAYTFLTEVSRTPTLFI